MKKWIKKLSLCVVLCLSTLSLNGCNVTKNQIAYTSYPIGYLVQRIVGDTLNCVSIQNDFESIQVATLKDDYREVLEASGVIFHVGDIEPYYPMIESDLKDLSIVDADLSGLNAIYLNQRYTPVIDQGQVVSYIESPYYNSDLFSMVDMSESDLNLWINPISMLSMAESICKQLVQMYPDNASIFQTNFENLKIDLVRIDAQFTALSNKMIASNQYIKFVSITNSFGNWQKPYGFQVYPLVLSQYGVLPTEQQLDVIKQRILADNVKYIVYESNVNEEMTALGEQVMEELGLIRVDLSNLSSLTVSQSESGKDYLTLMYENLAALETMLQSNESE